MCGVNPVNPGAAFGGINWACGTQHDHRHPVNPGVEDRHRAVHKPHITMQYGRQRLARHLGIAVGDGNRVLFMQHHDHLRVLIAQVVYDAVMQAAKARARVK